MMRVAAVVVTYNRRDMLRRCIEALLKQTGSIAPDILIVDNNSSDGTSDAVRECAAEARVLLTDSAAADNEQRRIVYKRLPYNSGGAGGFAFGIREAAEAGYDYLWLMDDDCIPQDNALEEFLKYDSLHHGEYGFLSSRVLWKDGSLCEMNVQRETVFRDISADRLSENSAPAEVSMASFVSLFIPAGIVYDVGLPIREFFVWTDDWEYTRRISRKYRCMVIPASTVVHLTAANAGADISAADASRIDRFRYLYRNDVYLYRREGIRGFGYEAARIALHTARVIRKGTGLRDRCTRIGIIFKGTTDGLRFCPCIDKVTRPERKSAD